MTVDGAGSPVPAYENIGGNFYDKYHARNPIARRLMQGFLASFDELTGLTGARNAFEIGCGEGHLSLRLLHRGVDTRGCDIDEDVVRQANQTSEAEGFGHRFSVESIYDMPEVPLADLVVCCEVLEHLPTPADAVARLARLAGRFLLVSVPREPIWSVLNVARGKYWGRLGNTPGHLQRWSSRRFVELLRSHLEVVELRQPLPWTMVLCKPRLAR